MLILCQSRPQVRLIVAAVASALLGAGCGKGKAAKDEEPFSLAEARVQVFPEKGPGFDRTFPIDSPEKIGDLAALDLPELDHVTGRMVVSFSFEVEGIRTPGMRMETSLVDGLVHGQGRNYGFFKGRWCLLGELNYEHGVKQGPFVVYHPATGAKAGEGTLVNGRREGGATWYNLNGDIIARTHYADGVLDGLSEVYNPAGEVIASGTYEHGALVSGTFVDDLDAYLLANIENRAVEPTIVTVPARTTDDTLTP